MFGNNPSRRALFDSWWWCDWARSKWFQTDCKTSTLSSQWFDSNCSPKRRYKGWISIRYGFSFYVVKQHRNPPKAQQTRSKTKIWSPLFIRQFSNSECPRYRSHQKCYQNSYISWSASLSMPKCKRKTSMVRNGWRK